MNNEETLKKIEAEADDYIKENNGLTIEYNTYKAGAIAESKNKTEEKYHFAHEVIFTLRSCHAISAEVYLHWIEKLNNEELEQLKLKP